MKTDKKFPDKLPFLPGNVYADPTITRYHKTQLLGVRDGIITEKTCNLQEPVNQELLNSMKSQGAPTLQSTQRPKQVNDSIPRVAPKWLKYDR